MIEGPISGFAGKSAHLAGDLSQAGMGHLCGCPREAPKEPAQIAGRADQIILQASFGEATREARCAVVL